MAAEVENRIATEKLLMARGYTWTTIAATLDLSEKQMKEDRRKIEAEKRENLQDEDVRETYEWYKDIATQAIEDLQIVQENADSSASQVAAAKGKDSIAKNVIEVGQNLGILPKAPDKSEVEGTHNVIIATEDRGELIDAIARHLKGADSESN